MPQFLLELFSEEIPARMQVRAIADLERLLNEALLGAGFLPEAVKGFAAPRRLTAVVEGLPARTADVREERKGPRVGAPEAAVQGFLKGAGLSSLDQAHVVEDKKGAFYVADIVKPGRATPEALAALIPDLIARFPWPKSMRWGEGSLQWVRPLQRIVAVFDGAVVPFSVGGIESGAETEGHRFHGAGVFAVRDFEDYEARLRAAGVILDREERKAIIAADARTLCQAQGLELVEDQGLLEEVAGLVDLPVVLMGAMDPAFLDLPPEVIRLTMRVNQKYFAVRDPASGGLAPKFIVVSNVRAEDGGAAILHGNGRVLTARLNDARYFWDLDRKTPLADRFARLETIVFHEKLGGVADKARRVAALAREIAPLVGADPDLCEQAAMLAKCDLATEMVGEFPELQGVMGRYYALENAGVVSSPGHGGGAGAAAGGRAPPNPAPLVGSADTPPASGGRHPAPAAVADAIRDHYKPLGPSDVVPTEPVSVAVALADKLDTLMGFFWIGETPTGSGDPFALRRAALGAQRIVVENRLPLYFRSILERHADAYSLAGKGDYLSYVDDLDALEAFMDERLRVALRNEGIAAEVVDAARIGSTDHRGPRTTYAMARLTRELAAFLKTDAGVNLIAGLKRAANILRAEERKGALPENLLVDVAHLSLGEEQALFDALDVAERDVETALGREDFAGAMTALAGVRGAVDAFFEAVVVNAEDADLRRNRLALLAGLKRTADRIADFSRIEG